MMETGTAAPVQLTEPQRALVALAQVWADGDNEKIAMTLSPIVRRPLVAAEVICGLLALTKEEASA